MAQFCNTCNQEVEISTKFCPQCGAKTPEQIAAESFTSQAKHYAGEAADEFYGAAKDAFKTTQHLADKDTAKKVGAGAAIGALAGFPIIGWAAGAAIGAGIVAYRTLNKKNSDT
jgi:ElaB/YqjD/DUF883 family membrane-anchored ribosome-binding protein